MEIGRAVVNYAWGAEAFSAGIKCRHWMYVDYNMTTKPPFSICTVIIDSKVIVKNLLILLFKYFSSHEQAML